MLEIVLFILKIAGIILVSVLGILITVACSVLFVPVRYRGDFFVSDLEDCGKKEIGVKLRAAWFLRFVRVHITFEEKFRVRVKVLFFTLMDTAKRKREKPEKKEKRKKKYEAEDGGSEGKVQSTDKSGETVSPENAEPEEAFLGDDVGEENRSGSKGKKTGESLISNILQTIRNFCDKLRKIKEKAEKAEKLWKAEHTVNSRRLLKRQFLYLLKHTKPKSLSGYLRFGFDDPSATGYAMAVYGMLYPVWNPKLSLEPDFEKQVLDSHILIKGKIRVWHFAKAALAIFFSKDVRRVIKEVKEI